MNRTKIKRYRTIGAVAGALALAVGLVLEYVPLIRSGGQGGTIPQANALCSGPMGLFVQGMVHAFAPGKASEVQHVCTLATTAEHFIGPLIVLGAIALIGALVVTIADRKGAFSPKLSPTVGDSITS